MMTLYNVAMAVVLFIWSLFLVPDDGWLLDMNDYPQG